MRKIFTLQNALTIIFCGAILFLFVKNSQDKSNAEAKSRILEESFSKASILNAYVQQQLDVAQLDNENPNKQISDTVQMFSISDGTRRSSQSLKLFCKEGKSKLIIRYSEIGCNSCSDSTIFALKKNPAIANYFDIVFLVDFSNLDAYNKWKKISEVEYPIYWVFKNSLPFDAEQQNQSYIFTTDKELRSSNFFIPNSMYPEYIASYLKNLEKKCKKA